MMPSRVPMRPSARRLDAVRPARREMLGRESAVRIAAQLEPRACAR